ncbi:MAG: YkgJ family cysteine cluster protein [Dehalococcoidia bacterium]|nr:YkgJ family cysteine cluster protein [Dehalococcoidia bacterium]
MADLDLPEMKMFARWHGITGLADNDDFWHDCAAAYTGKSVTLPVYDTPADREAVLNMVKCPPGECGRCCRAHDGVHITHEEYTRLTAFSGKTPDVIIRENGKMFLHVTNGCEFLKNNACTIYAVRPDICRTFPLVTSQNAVSSEGVPVRQLRIKLICTAALDAAKSILTRACTTGNLILLPDMSLVPAYKDGKGLLGPI